MDKALFKSCRLLPRTTSMSDEWSLAFSADTRFDFECSQEKWFELSFLFWTLLKVRKVRWLMAHDDKLSNNAWYFTIRHNKQKKNWCSYHSNRVHHSINAVCHQNGRKTHNFFCSFSVYNHTLRPIHQYFIKIYYLWSLLWNLFISLSFHHLRRWRTKTSFRTMSSQNVTRTQLLLLLLWLLSV